MAQNKPMPVQRDVRLVRGEQSKTAEDYELAKKRRKPKKRRAKAEATAAFCRDCAQACGLVVSRQDVAVYCAACHIWTSLDPRRAHPTANKAARWRDTAIAPQ